MMQRGQNKNQLEAKKRNNQIIQNLKQTLSTPTIVEAQRTLKIVERLISRLGISMNLDSEFITKFNQINNPAKCKLNRALFDGLTSQVQESLIRQARMEIEFRGFAQIEQQLKDEEVVEEDRLQEYNRSKKDLAYSFKSLIRALEKHPADISILKSLKLNNTPNTEVSNIHQALCNYKIIMQKTLATAAEEDESHARLIEELQMRISSLDKTKVNCEKDLLKLREDRAKHGEDKKEEMDRLKGQIKETKSNNDKQMEEIESKSKELRENREREHVKEEDNLKAVIKQEQVKLSKTKDENAKAEGKSKNDKMANEAHFVDTLSQYDTEIKRVSNNKRTAEQELRRITDELSNLKRHFLEIEEERAREEALVKADKRRKHEYELMEGRRGAAMTKVKEAYRLWKNKNKKKKKKK